MRKRILRYAALGAVTTCILFAAKVTTDYDHSADFGQYHTYSWERVKAGDQLWADRITRDVDQQLSAKGWQKVESGGDVAVTGFGSTKEQPTLNTFYDGFGGWRWGGFGETTTTVTNTPVGTLVVDMFDARTKHLIWRGMSAETLSGKPEKNENKLADAVKDMFKKFPPPAKS
ncbi:MAG: DUF4136 domain-containing protein [Bryobacteraceae bacterium]